MYGEVSLGLGIERTGIVEGWSDIVAFLRFCWSLATTWCALEFCGPCVDTRTIVDCFYRRCHSRFASCKSFDGQSRWRMDLREGRKEGEESERDEREEKGLKREAWNGSPRVEL